MLFKIIKKEKEQNKKYSNNSKRRFLRKGTFPTEIKGWLLFK